MGNITLLRAISRVRGNSKSEWRRTFTLDCCTFADLSKHQYRTTGSTRPMSPKNSILRYVSPTLRCCSHNCRTYTTVMAIRLMVYWTELRLAGHRDSHIYRQTNTHTNIYLISHHITTIHITPHHTTPHHTAPHRTTTQHNTKSWPVSQKKGWTSRYM